MSTCCDVTSSVGLQCGFSSGMVLWGLQGDNLLHHDLAWWRGTLHGLQGNLCWQHLEHFPPILVHRPWCLQACISHFLIPLTAYTQWFLPFLKYVITELPPVSLMGSTLASGMSFWSRLELAQSDMGVITLMSGHRSHRCSSVLTKPYYIKQIQLHFYLWLLCNTLLHKE